MKACVAAELGGGSPKLWHESLTSFSTVIHPYQDNADDAVVDQS